MQTKTDTFYHTQARSATTTDQLLMAGGAGLGAVYVVGTIRTYTLADMSALGVKEKVKPAYLYFSSLLYKNLINAYGISQAEKF